MRVVLETNVLVSAFATRGVCADVLRVVLAEHTRVTGERDIDEFLREHEVAPKPVARAAVPRRDPDDQWVVASAVESRAEVLVTGDRDLLDIAANAPIRIVDPRGFWDLVRKNE